MSACNTGDLGWIPGSGRSPGKGNGNPLQYSCLENPMDGGAWWATVHGVAKSRTPQQLHFHFQFSSVTQSCPTLCDPMDCSKSGFPDHHHSQSLFKLMSIELVMPSNHLFFVIPFFSCLQSFPSSGSFLTSRLFTSGGQSIGAPASASVLPMNIQD